jgi:aspartyl-tRNA(Asn)/glutamyl-tRNA(Gln) amidotransferase subunit A
MMRRLRDTINALQTHQLSSVELTAYFLEKIDKHQSLNAFISLDIEHALALAKQADKRLAQGNAPLFTGIPIAHKDIFCTMRMPTTCGSRMLETFVSPYQATVVNRLEAAGSILLGKTNMDEFAMGSSNETSYFGAVKNPWDNQYTPGGSSGGSAAAVAAGLVAFATGSDTGGSIRQPAAFCGISGLKPTYGLVSRFGMVAYASSLDQAGPMARSVDDLALILQVMAGFDPLDSTSVKKILPNYSDCLTQPINGLRIGVPRCFSNVGVDSAIQKAIDEALDCFKAQGAIIIDIDLIRQPLWVPCYYVIACAEASSNLSRYDGIRFGYRCKQASNLQALIKCSRTEGFGLEVRRRILTGTYVLSSGYFDAYYLQALKIRRLIQQELLDSFASVDAILGPVSPNLTPKLGKTCNDPQQHYLADLFTVAANLAGLPAISIPAGVHNGLPIGMQLMGSPFSEARLLNLAYCYQQSTNWHLACPKTIGESS